MITLELLRLIRNGHGCDAELAVRIHADGTDISIDGPEPELVDVNQPVLNLRDGTTITCADDPEEWVRALPSEGLASEVEQRLGAAKRSC